ncbi:MAG: proteasome assembly chaperone family protein [Candidatus Altiarchaeota archaeon]|nr:proteasome assembly chaperone family protein [Candidatus Altiarchaeota archaeon]
MIMWKVEERPLLYKPVLIEGLPGVGNVGKMTVEYLIQKLKAKKFAEIYSDHFPYHVFIDENSTVNLPRNEFYYYKGGKHDVVFLTGDFQSMTPQGHYEIIEAVLNFSKELGVKEIITVGGYGIEGIPKNPQVLGAVTHDKIIKHFKAHGVTFEDGERVGMIVGASGLLLGLGKLKGFEGICLMGETFSRPMFTDARASKAVLEVISDYFGIKIDMGDMNTKAKELDKAITKAKELEDQMVKQATKPEQDLSYIG